jgi:hypothetical protein
MKFAEYVEKTHKALEGIFINGVFDDCTPEGVEHYYDYLKQEVQKQCCKRIALLSLNQAIDATSTVSTAMIDENVQNIKK